MPLSYKSASIPTSFATCSIGIGDPSATLLDKLRAISEASFDGIELSMPDILSYGKSTNGAEPDPRDYDTLVKLAQEIKKITSDLNLKILMLQPFANFEGWPKGSQEREEAFTRAKGWFRIMEAVGTDMLQVGSSDSPGITSNFDELAADLAELADLAA